MTWTRYRSERLLEVVVSHGDGLEPTAHGVIGVFTLFQVHSFRVVRFHRCTHAVYSCIHSW